jgi:hypothetical protein
MIGGSHNRSVYPLLHLFEGMTTLEDLQYVVNAGATARAWPTSRHDDLGVRQPRPVDERRVPELRYGRLRLRQGGQPHQPHGERHGEDEHLRRRQPDDGVGDRYLHLRRQRQPDGQDHRRRDDDLQLRRARPADRDSRAGDSGLRLQRRRVATVGGATTRFAWDVLGLPVVLADGERVRL